MLPEFLRRKPKNVPTVAPTAGVTLHVTDQGIQQTDAVPDGLEMALPFRQIAAIFIANGWRFSLDAKTVVDATPEGITALAAGLLDDMISDPNMLYSGQARLMAIRDARFPDDVDLYLHIGNTTTKIEEGPVSV